MKTFINTITDEYQETLKNERNNRYYNQEQHLEELKVLTKSLGDLVNIFSDNYTTYNTPGGTCIGLNLFNDKVIAVQRCFLTQGGMFPEHIHEEIEIIVVYDGEAQIVIEGIEKTQILKVGDIVRIEPNKKHEFTALTDVWVIGITIPASTAYPK